MKIKKNSVDEGKLSDRGHGLGTVTEGMVRQRARELAAASGRDREQVLDSDVEQARRELTGQEGLNPEPTPAEQLPEEKRWEPVAESVGYEATTIAPSDEQTVEERLVEEGVAEAEQDQMAEAGREERKRAREACREKEYYDSM
jgi:hypothetical protein